MRGVNNQRGQVTIFIILALVIVVMGVLIYAFLPRLTSTSSLESENPAYYLESCMSQYVSDGVEALSLNGGILEPESYFLYEDNTIAYFCYNQDYKLCITQEPFIEKKFEEELKNYLAPHLDSCFSALEDNFDSNGYNVGLDRSSNDFSVEVLPERILLRIDSELRLSKDSTQTYESFDIFYNNNIYQLLSLTKTIINQEAKFGDADTWLYMMAYKDLKIQKLKQSDDTKIYILENKNTGQNFQFASRSLAWPAGY